MPRAPGHDPGHEGLPPGLTWEEYLDWLVSTEGTLAAVAEKLAARRGYKDDAASVERALRRLRARANLAGGTWGLRALAAFGLPAGASARARWMGTYHSRFTDLPVPLCLDLVRLWDRPPISEAPDARLWLALAHATCALRGEASAEAAEHLARGHAFVAAAPADAVIEHLLTRAYLASRSAPADVALLLVQVEPLLERPMADADRACLRARWIDQRTYAIHRGEVAGQDANEAERLYQSIETRGAPSFALSRRASGLAYIHWKRGDSGTAADLARAAAEHAGDGGHLRLRAMALQMLSRILGKKSGEAEAARALAIVTTLDDDALRLRFTRGR